MIPKIIYVPLIIKRISQLQWLYHRPFPRLITQLYMKFSQISNFGGWFFYQKIENFSLIENIKFLFLSFSNKWVLKNFSWKRGGYGKAEYLRRVWLKTKALIAFWYQIESKSGFIFLHLKFINTFKIY